MHRAIAVLAIVALSLAASTGAARASSKELQIIKTSIEGTSVVLVIENTTNALVTGRCLGRFNNGETIQDDVEVLTKIEPGVHEVTLDFPEKGSYELQAIRMGSRPASGRSLVSSSSAPSRTTSTPSSRSFLYSATSAAALHLSGRALAFQLCVPQWKTGA